MPAIYVCTYFHKADDSSATVVVANGEGKIELNKTTQKVGFMLMCVYMHMCTCAMLASDGLCTTGLEKNTGIICNVPWIYS